MTRRERAQSQLQRRSTRVPVWVLLLALGALINLVGCGSDDDSETAAAVDDDGSSGASDTTGDAPPSIDDVTIGDCLLELEASAGASGSTAIVPIGCDASRVTYRVVDVVTPPGIRACPAGTITLDRTSGVPGQVDPPVVSQLCVEPANGGTVTTQTG